jgi:predicted small secreted protein
MSDPESIATPSHLSVGDVLVAVAGTSSCANSIGGVGKDGKETLEGAKEGDEPIQPYTSRTAAGTISVGGSPDDAASLPGRP